MQNGPKTVMSRRQPDRRRHLLPAQSGGPRVPPAQTRRALKTRKETMSGIWLARAEAQSGNMIGAENYYQHAEHYFRSMSSDRGTT